MPPALLDTQRAAIELRAYKARSSALRPPRPYLPPCPAHGGETARHDRLARAAMEESEKRAAGWEKSDGGEVRARCEGERVSRKRGAG